MAATNFESLPSYETGVPSTWLNGINKIVKKQTMDSQLKTLTEVTYESIFDSSLNPTGLRGSRTGVFCGTTNGSQEKTIVKETTPFGNGKKLYAGKLSTEINFRCPVQTVDTKCSQSLVAPDNAIDILPQKFERLVQWEERFQQEQKQQQRLVQQMLRQQQQPEKLRKLLEELEQLIHAEQHQEQQVQWGEKSLMNSKFQHQQIFDKVQQQIHNFYQQQRLVQQVLRQGQQPEFEQQGLFDELRQIIQEQQQFELEQQVDNQEKIEFFWQLKQFLIQKLRIVEALIKSTFEQHDVEPKAFLAELEQEIQFQLAIVQERRLRHIKANQNLKQWQQRLQQYQFNVQQMLGQKQLQGKFRQIVVELQAVFDEQIQYALEKDMYHQKMKPFFDFIDQSLRKQLETVEFLNQQKLQLAEKRQFYVEVEKFLQERVKYVIKIDLQIRKHLDNNSRIQYKLEQILEQVEQEKQQQEQLAGKHYYKEQHQKQLTEEQRLVEELRQVIKQKQQLKKQLVLDLEQLKQNGQPIQDHHQHQRHNF